MAFSGKWPLWQPRLNENDFELKAIASRDSDLYFHASCRIRWRERTRTTHKNPLSAIRSQLNVIAGQVAERFPVTRADAVEDGINSLLGLPVPVRDSMIRIEWGRAVVRADPISISESMHREQRRREIKALADQQDHKIRYIEDFARKVLSRPDLAMTYVFLERRGEVESAVLGKAEEFARNVARYDPENFWIQVSDILLEFVRGLSLAERRESIEVLRHWLRRYERDDLIARFDGLTEEPASRLGQ